ncbi:MAG: prenyltransferase/squalene oxidase repeat-containing protein [Candidatus Methanofastidiosia archaeon]
MNLKKTVEFLKNLQNEDGSYPCLKPSPHTTRDCLGVLCHIQKKPKFANTINWVKSLQTDHRGFGETTGQNSWVGTTHMGSEMHKFLGIKLRYYKDFINFVNSHQNEDGGFGNIGEPESNISATIQWAESLLNIRAEVKNKERLALYLNKNLESNTNLYIIYHIIQILKKLNIKIKNREEIINFVKQIETNNIEFLYYKIAILNDFLKLNKKELNINAIKSTIKENLLAEPRKTFFATGLAKLLDYKINVKELEDYIDKLELNEGGYYYKDLNLLTAYECVQSLMILKKRPYYSKKAAEWIKKCQTPDGGFGASPGSNSWINMQFRAIRCLKILNEDFEKKRIKEYLDKNIFPINSFNAYYGTYGYLELNEVAPNYRKIILNVLAFQNKDGGFSGAINGFSEMYETKRCVVAISNILKVLEFKKIQHINWMNKIRDKVISWILSCENKNGGFSWVPNEIPYVQPTYQALNVLWVLNAKPKNMQNHINFIIKFQNKDGGFNGGEKKTPSYSLYTYYALASLIILDEMLNEKKNDIHVYLGL